MSPSPLTKVLSFTLVFSSCCVGVSLSASNTRPVVDLSYGSFQGNATGNLVQFLGMPFAAPPVGDLRFAMAEPPLNFTGVRQATSFGAACIQQTINVPSSLGVGSVTSPGINVTSEDCLFINVVKPACIPAGKKLPVLFWIYGGGFDIGDTSQNPGDTVVARSIALGEPVIYVSTNYRLQALGFLGGKEVQAAKIGNLGIGDQRFALKWVQEYICAFGGDPNQVTIWGESAGAISVGLHLLIDDGDPKGLFHGAFMESGSPMTLPDITTQQPLFDQVVTDTGCTGSADLIACLRTIPLDTLMTAVNKAPTYLSYNSQDRWQPSIDGNLIVRNPLVSVHNGLYAKVSIVTGDCGDEGTAFSFASTNITNNADFLAYIQSVYFNGSLTTEQLTYIGLAYPDDITQGSPFDTGTANAITPEFKRIAAFFGDFTFQAPRRFFLEHASKTQNAFAFLFNRGKSPFGALHGSDTPEFYGSSALVYGSTGSVLPDFIGTDALINFANTGNPTIPYNSMSLLSNVDWQQWGSSDQHPLLTFLDPAPNVSITFDTFRADAMNLLNNITLGLASACASQVPLSMSF